MSDLLDDRLIIEVSPLPSELEDYTLRVSDLHGIEAMSTLYDFDLSVACNKPGGISPEAIDELLAADVCVGFGPRGERRVHGILNDIELVSIPGPSSHGDAIYRFQLVPRFHRTQLTRRSRCFVGLSIPEIIAQVLEESDVSHELRLVGTYRHNNANHDAGLIGEMHVMQYEESDYDFLCRWMERLGIYYFFEQSDDDGDVLVLTDANRELTDAPSFPEVRYSQTAGTTESGRLTSLRQRTRLQPRHVHVRDFNWRNTADTKLVLGDAPVNPAHPEAGFGLQIHYGDHHLTDREGERMAQIRAEGWLVRKNGFSGASKNHDWSPGHTFTLTQPDPVHHGDDIFPELYKKYLLTAVTHSATWGQGGGTYTNTVEMLDYAFEYRPVRETPWPRIEGVINGRIDDGPEHIRSSAPIDARGRYRVILPYDYYAKIGHRPSSWVRKGTPYAGLNHGMHFTLHSGCEVLLAHIDGDPDRPVIVGAIANDWNTSPVTELEKTRSVIRTRSGIVFDFEDDAT